MVLWLSGGMPGNLSHLGWWEYPDNHSRDPFQASHVVSQSWLRGNNFARKGKETNTQQYSTSSEGKHPSDPLLCHRNTVTYISFWFFIALFVCKRGNYCKVFVPLLFFLKMFVFFLDVFLYWIHCGYFFSLCNVI